MQIHPAILAATEDSTVKVVVGVIVFVIWAISQLATKMNEKKTPTPLPKIEIPQGPPPVPQPSPSPTRRTQPNKRAQIQQGKQDRQNRGLQSQQAPPPMINHGTKVIPPPLRQKPKPVQVEEQHTPITASPVTLGYYHREGPTRAEKMKTLLRPGNLRKEFILTEIFQKPISMRNE